MPRPRLHLVGIFHTQHTQAYSHCAFTGKALRFPQMMQTQNYTVIEYSNEGSESTADEHVVMITASEFDTLFNRSNTAFYGDDATVGSKGHQLFEQRLIPALRERLQPEDIICHPFGHAHQQLMVEFPNHQHVETGIGYPTLMPDSFRIFESYTWMHYHQGKENRNGRNYEWCLTTTTLMNGSQITNQGNILLSWVASLHSKELIPSRQLLITALGPSFCTAKEIHAPGATQILNIEDRLAAPPAVNSYATQEHY